MTDDDVEAMALSIIPEGITEHQRSLLVLSISCGVMMERERQARKVTLERFRQSVEKLETSGALKGVIPKRPGWEGWL